MESDEVAEAGWDLVHLDSAQVRRLAHPLRSRLLGTLRVDGPATSAGLAERLGTNTGATSYHLRQLAEVGLVVEDERRGTARERWWQAAHRYSSWGETDFDDDPDAHAAASWLIGQNIRLTASWRERWRSERDDWPEEWRRAADSSDVRLVLTPGQLRSLNDEILAIVQRYEAAGPDGNDAQPVMILLDTFPAPDLAM